MSRANTVAPTTRAVPSATPRTLRRMRRGGRAPGHPVLLPVSPASAAARSSGSPAAGASADCGRRPCARTSARSIQPASVMKGKRSHRRPGVASCSSSPISGPSGSHFPASAGVSAGTHAARGRHVPPTHALLSYFDPVDTTRRLRPFLRRRFSVCRPALVLMRARKPCLFFRFRLRGLYVGFPMTS